MTKHFAYALSWVLDTWLCTEWGKCRDMNITVCAWVSEVRTGSVGTFAQLTGSIPGPSMSLSVLDIVMSSKDKALAFSTKLLYF